MPHRNACNSVRALPVVAVVVVALVGDALAAGVRVAELVPQLPLYIAVLQLLLCIAVPPVLVDGYTISNLLCNLLTYYLCQINSAHVEQCVIEFLK